MAKRRYNDVHGVSQAWNAKLDVFDGADEIATEDYVDDAISDLSAVYAPIAKGVTNGDTHDHNGGDGNPIAHASPMTGIGTNTHAQIDTHITAAAAHIASTSNPHAVTAAQAGAGPSDAVYIVGSASAGLSAERVVTDTATIAWDQGTAGQLKANIPNDAITYAKMQNVAANKVLGSIAGGDPEEIDCTATGRSILDDASVAAVRATLGDLYATSAGATIPGTGLVDITADVAIPAGKMFGLVGSFKFNITATDDLGIQWTATSTVTAAVGWVMAGLSGELAVNTASGLIATNGADQRMTFLGTVSGGASGGNFKLQARKNTDAAGDGGTYAADTGFVLIPMN